MRYPTVPRCCAWISLLSALLSLAGCANEPRVVYRDRTIEVPVAVVEKTDPRLTADCAPRTDLPPDGPLTIRAMKERLAAVEDALAICRNDKALLRATQP